MLVLSRNVDQTVMVGNNIKVRVLAIHGNQVRLGIEAPRTISINREEVQRRIEAGEPRRGASVVVNVDGIDKGRSEKSAQSDETEE